MIELELTYLAKNLPEKLRSCKSKEIIDVYFPESSVHPTLRLRKNGGRFEITKKEPVNEGDASVMKENTIPLTKEEFLALSQAPGKKVHKVRYYFEHEGRVLEFDVFQGPLLGLVVVDVEFESEEQKGSFSMPDFCLVDITQETFIAGGMICGKSYADVEDKLHSFEYKQLFLQ